MDPQILHDIGLSKNESKVYLALIEIGTCTATQIAQKSKVHRTNVYDAIERLIEKGLISYITKNGKKFFEATEPGNLINLLKIKEEQLKSVLPQLILQKQLSKKTEVNVYEGSAAARHTLMKLLDYNETIYNYGTPASAVKILGSAFLEKFQRERIARKIPQKIIYDESAHERIEQLKTLTLCEVRALPKEFNSPMSTNICGDIVYLKLYTSNPCLTIWMDNKDIANIFRKYFEVMWKIAKKV